jgi:hypothetical protein
MLFERNSLGHGRSRDDFQIVEELGLSLKETAVLLSCPGDLSEKDLTGFRTVTIDKVTIYHTPEA